MKIIEADPSIRVVIRGDGGVQYERVMVVMSELQKVGAKDIGLITKAPSDR